jgi:hypothetical protein
MAKVVKNRQIYARIDADMNKRITAYIEQSPGLVMAEMVRLAVEEYMEVHKVKEN